MSSVPLSCLSLVIPVVNWRMDSQVGLEKENIECLASEDSG